MTKKFLIIGFVWPEPKSSAAGTRMLQLIQQFQNQNFDITFCSSAKRTDKSYDLESIGVTTASVELNSSSFDEFISAINPDMVLFDRFMTEEQFGWRVSEQCPDAIKILDTEDFHGLRKGRELAVKANEPFSKDYLHNDFTKREIASIFRCDLSLIISEVEMNILIDDFKVDKGLLHYLPFLIDEKSTKEKDNLPPFEQRKDFIIIGNFLHAPNYDSILFLKDSIWPIIKASLPDTRLNIYGAYESSKIKQLNDLEEDFVIKGFAEDVNEVMKSHRICLVPLRFGAGLKGKVFDAFNNGTPCVMSSIASEGILITSQSSDLIQDDPECFAEKAIELYSNPMKWIQAQNIGFEVLINRFSKTAFEKDFKDRITSLQDTIADHRKNNFIGQILMHQTMQGTKYMSKWIEEKNKK